MNRKVIKVGMAEIHHSFSPDILKTTGLGSCVGVCIYDNFKKIGGMAHVMLPDSKNSRHTTTILGKFADTAIEELIKRIVNAGAGDKNLVAKIAGGAQMFSFAGSSDIMKIGQRNIEAVKENLDKFNIKIVAEDVGGNYGRTIEFDLLTGQLYVRTISQGEKII